MDRPVPTFTDTQGKKRRTSNDKTLKGAAIKGLVRLKKSREMDENLRAMMAFALPGYTYTLDDIAECIGCSKERVRQIQDTALRKLRRRTDYLKRELKKR